MKRLLVAVVLLCGFLPWLVAAEGCDQHLTKDEFRNRQKAYIVEKAGLTEEEAAAFFPLYFELQDKKQQLNEEAWSLLREGKKKGVSEERYEEIMEGVYDARISADKLEKAYFGKFREILTYRKIYLVQRAEMSFHRELLKGMRGKGAPRKGRK